MFDRTADGNGDPTERTPLTESAATRNKDDIINDTLYNDHPDGMTRARRIARYLSQYNWYLPKPPQQPDISNLEGVPSGDIKKPNLDMAWEYFEHIGLPRCETKRDNVNKTYIRVEPGETIKSTMLYPVWSTPLVDMGDFGTGVGLYFFTVKFFAIITFIAGLINIPGLMYFYSDEYSTDDANNGNNDNEYALLKMSAVCTSKKWEPCPSCLHSQSGDEAHFAFGEASDGSQLAFIKVNHCLMDGTLGMSSYISLIFVIGAIYALTYFKASKESYFDEAVQTSQDYSIKIKNPPPNATDPEDWKKFFQQKFDVTVNVCTIVINNAGLLRALIHRRRLLNKLHNMVPHGQLFDPDDLDKTAENCLLLPLPLWKKIVCCAKSPRRIVELVKRTEVEIVALTKDPQYNVSEVFMTFSTEEEQRKVLDELTVPRLREWQMDKKYWYEETVLRIMEPDEPESICWSNLDVTIPVS